MTTDIEASWSRHHSLPALQDGVAYSKSAIAWALSATTITVPTQLLTVTSILTASVSKTTPPQYAELAPTSATVDNRRGHDSTLFTPSAWKMHKTGNSMMDDMSTWWPTFHSFVRFFTYCCKIVFICFSVALHVVTGEHLFGAGVV